MSDKAVAPSPLLAASTERLATALWATDIEGRAERVANGAFRWDDENMHAYRETYRAKAARLIASGAVVPAASLADDEAVVEVVARSLASMEPGEEWPSNSALGGSLTGTRDDEYRHGKQDEASDALRALAAALEDR